MYNKQEQIRNAAVVKRTTALHAEDGRNPLFKYVSRLQKYFKVSRS